MHCAKILILTASVLNAREFSGARALEFTRQVSAVGPHVSGSPAIARVQSMITAQLRLAGCAVTTDAFTATTPRGPVAMKNILCRFAGKSGKTIAITGHYDTKRLPGFVGANDGGSSAGFLMELALALAHTPRQDDVVLIFFDGEEAVENWTDTDSLYGSRHLANKWSADGSLARLKALINVDMIGDKDLELIYDLNSNATLRDMVWKRATDLGYGAHFPYQQSGMEDDHMPFIRLGARALDLIDFSYGPNNSYWHTTSDTVDKLGAASFAVVGNVVTDAIRQLEQTP